MSGPDPFDTYLNYQDLPQQATEGDQAFVTTTDELYTFVEQVDGHHVGMWIPTTIASKGLSYAKGANGQPIRIAQSTPRSSSKPSPFANVPVEIEWADDESKEKELKGWDDDPLDA